MYLMVLNLYTSDGSKEVQLNKTDLSVYVTNIVPQLLRKGYYIFYMELTKLASHLQKISLDSDFTSHTNLNSRLIKYLKSKK